MTTLHLSPAFTQQMHTRGVQNTFGNYQNSQTLNSSVFAGFENKINPSADTFTGSSTKKSTVAGKIAGGAAGFALLAPLANKGVMTSVLPKIKSVFQPLADAARNLPKYVKVDAFSPEKTKPISEAVKALSKGNKAILVAAILVSSLATILLGGKIGSFIQSKFQKN